MRKLIACFVVFWAAVGTGWAAAEVVTPSDRVQTQVTVYKGPGASTGNAGSLAKGKTAELLGSVPAWYKIRLADGKVGYVSKSWTDLVQTAVAPVSASTSGASYTLDVIDVGTGLALLVKGDDFAVVYDGGSNDDTALGDENRMVAYLHKAWPSLSKIDHVILSHPHRDHVELLADVISKFAVVNVWDSGRFNDICGYRAFLSATSKKMNAKYHDAVHGAGQHTVKFKERDCDGRGSLPTLITMNDGPAIETGTAIPLGAGASMTFLHADADKEPDVNDNSLVVRMDLGAHKVLFVGDAGGGDRLPVSTAPAGSSVEATLLACCAAELKSDVLIVGHHGSLTSSRNAFIDKVGAKHFVISAGPTKYKTVVLPDDDVVNALAKRGEVYRTDLTDNRCGTAPKKIGPDDDNQPGGCDNIRFNLGDGEVVAEYLSISD